MPSERKPRPSFEPPDAASRSEGAQAGWVYRSDNPDDPRPPAAIRWASRIERGAVRGAERIVETTAVPIEMLLAMTLFGGSGLSWPWVRRRKAS